MKPGAAGRWVSGISDSAFFGHWNRSVERVMQIWLGFCQPLFGLQWDLLLTICSANGGIKNNLAAPLGSFCHRSTHFFHPFI